MICKYLTRILAYTTTSLAMFWSVYNKPVSRVPVALHCNTEEKEEKKIILWQHYVASQKHITIARRIRPKLTTHLTKSITKTKRKTVFSLFLIEIYSVIPERTRNTYAYLLYVYIYLGG